MSKVDISDGICAYLTGGFGNQLFVAAAGFAASQRLGCPLYLDLSGLAGPNETRKFALGDVDFGSKLLLEDSPWFGDHPNRGQSILGRFRRQTLQSGGGKVWREAGFDYDPSFESIRPGTTITGFMQSPKYFRDVAVDVRDRILSGANSTRGMDRASNSVTMHMRRGDYLDAATARYHGVASVDYFARSLSLLDRLGAFGDVYLYSDSPETVVEELRQHRLADRYRFVNGSQHLTELDTIVEMSHGAAFVMSNSSFSWWAAWLMSGSSDATVVAPRPWLSVTGTSASDLLLPGWLTLDHREAHS